MYAGQTPISFDLPPGTYEVQTVRDGEMYVDEVTLVAGEARTLNYIFHSDDGGNGGTGNGDPQPEPEHGGGQQPGYTEPKFNWLAIAAAMIIGLVLLAWQGGN